MGELAKLVWGKEAIFQDKGRAAQIQREQLSKSIAGTHGDI